MTAEECYFCGQIAGSPDHSLLYELLGSRWSARPVLRENEGAVAMPSIGALVAGHVLISPQQHLRSFAVASAEQLAALDRLVHTTTRELHDATGLPIHGFEHGSSACGERVACSVEHAHRHLIPCRDAAVPGLWEAARWRQLGQSETLASAAEGREYLSYHAPDGRTWVATTENGFPSQLLRRVFASAIGHALTWDWRSHPQAEAVLATIALFDKPEAGRPAEPAVATTHTLAAA
jgi:diadenosine tetraphosphate (Ap4A) HIT family hydrolase